MCASFRAWRRPMAGRILLSLLITLTISVDPVSAQNLNSAVKASIRRGVTFLKKAGFGIGDGNTSLGAYAMLVGGEPPNQPLIAKSIQFVKDKIKQGSYEPFGHHVYEAGIDLMMLEAAGGDQYAAEMEVIVEYLVSNQRSPGQWDYPNQNNGGDTSITQYAILGLWAARRAGVEVPLDTWNRAAKWLMTTQAKNEGGFPYHAQSGVVDPLHSMTAAGAGCLGVIKLNLPAEKKKTPAAGIVTPDSNVGDSESKKDDPKKPSVYTTYGILERIDFGEGEKKRAEEAIDEGGDGEEFDPFTQVPEGERLVTREELDRAMGRGVGWIATRFTVSRPSSSHNNAWGENYYLYCLERMAALRNLQRIGNHDWYTEGASHLMNTQQQDGSWNRKNASMTTVASTSFAILFLSRSTGKLVGIPQPDDVGNGLLAGGRGLADDLSQVRVKDGKVVEEEKPKTPIDELLAELSDPTKLSLEEAQTAIVEQVQIGNREELIGQKETLLKLVKHPDTEIRRTALWALARCDDMQLVPAMIDALEESDVDVIVEARNALCTMTRMPRGLGMPDNPLEGLPANARQAQKDAAVEKWRTEALKRWRGWYYENRPYTKRDDIAELKLNQQK